MTALPAALAAIVTEQRELAELRIQATAARRAALVEGMLRDDLAEARRELAISKLMFRAAMDALVIATVVPRRYEQMLRALAEERVEFIKRELCAEVGVVAEDRP